ncbi:MAG: hypothetical protein C5B47_02445 [Verrucomicrobia bacterium]|nr:MAG: hypothetical protein C5B47_02445 [Verrucomicrobiota bacterium]
MCALEGERILITGGSGSLGRVLTRILSFSSQVVVYSRNEERQFEMLQEIGNRNIEYVIGDIRDCQELTSALRGCTIAIHAAAMKDIIRCQRQPFQAILNNVYGTEALLKAALRNKIKKIIGISTDKAASPASVYGASKYIMEQLILEVSQIVDGQAYCIRFGNMIDSKGSLVPLWKKNPNRDLSVSDPEASRFFFTVEAAAKCIVQLLTFGKNGRIYIPKMKKAKIIKILQLLTGRKKFFTSGLCAGEKLHEMLVSEEERKFCFEEDDFFTLDYNKMNTNPPKILNSQWAEEIPQAELYRMIFSGAA